MLLCVRKDKLIAKRKMMNLSQHELSLLSGLSGNAVFRMEAQSHKVNPLRAKAVANVLNCEVSEIFYPSE